MQVENLILIDAPKSIVWKTSIDVKNWPRWSPTCDSIQRLEDGPFEVGSRAQIKQPGLPEAVWVVTSLQSEESFTWETKVRGMRMIATHELAAAQEGTESLLRLEVKGVVARLLWPLIRVSIKRSLERENAGLKAECEAAVDSASEL